MTTNAIGLSDRIFELEKCGLNKVNISLDSLKEYKYKSVTRGGNLKDVLKSIESCLNLGIKVKLNCVAISGFNDDELKDFMFLTVKSPIDVRFIELMPLGEANRVYKKGYFNVKEMIEKIYGLEFTFSPTLEFENREDGLVGLSRDYGLKFKDVKAMNGSKRFINRI